MNKKVNKKKDFLYKTNNCDKSENDKFYYITLRRKKNSYQQITRWHHCLATIL